jgi:uncharacterized protein
MRKPSSCSTKEAPVSDKFETRSFAEFRVARESGSPVIEGYAIVFNSLSEDLGGFREVIAPAAVDRALAEDHDVRALIDHDSTLILGRSKSGTLRMVKDSHGLRVQITPPDTSYARDLLAVIERGDVSGMSFGFMTPEGGDTWARSENGTAIRTVNDLYLRDVSVVTYPAYPATEVARRSLEAFEKASEREADVEKIVTAMSEVWGTPESDLWRKEQELLRSI